MIELARFIKTLQNEGMAWNTINGYSSDIEVFSEFLQQACGLRSHRVNAQLVDKSLVRKFYLHLEEKGHTPRDIQRKFSSLRRFFRMMKQKRVVKRDPTEGFSAPPVERVRVKAIGQKRLRSILSSLPKVSLLEKRDRAIVALMAASGITAPQAENVNCGDLDLEGRRLLVRGGHKHFGWSRFADEAVLALLEYLNVRSYLATRNPNTEQALFLNRRGRRLTRQRIWMLVKERIGLRTFDVRHAYGEHAARRGETAEELAEQLGVSEHTVEKYTKGAKR